MPDPADLAQVRESFGKLAEVFDHAMNDPAMTATPHVAVVLHLLGEGLITLARVVFDNARIDGSEGAAALGATPTQRFSRAPSDPTHSDGSVAESPHIIPAQKDTDG